VSADIWSCPSFNELRRQGLETDRWNLLHPTQAPRPSYVEQCLSPRQGPVVASTDYMRSFADQIRPFVPRRYVCLGTDGFGRSDYRIALRKFFEVDRHYVATAALNALAQEDAIPKSKVEAAVAKYGIDPERPPPWKM
jgi:pyruvate dehydrogenase E1 component